MEALFPSYCSLHLFFIPFVFLFPYQFIFLFPYQFMCQGPDLGNQTNSCSINHTSTPIAYSCPVSFYPGFDCDSYLMVRSKAHNLDLGFNGISVGNTTFLKKDVYCQCRGNFYRHDTEYYVKSGDSNEKIVNDIFHGFTSRSLLKGMNSNYDIDDTRSIGRALRVRLTCACPSEAQRSNGVTSFVVYMLQSNETIKSIARDFGVEEESILKANMLSNSSHIFPFTPLLVPLWENKLCIIHPNKLFCRNDTLVFRSRLEEITPTAIILIVSVIGMFIYFTFASLHIFNYYYSNMKVKYNLATRG